MELVEARGFLWYKREGHRHIASQFQYENYTIEWLKWVVNTFPEHRKLFVDVGGNEGMYPVMFSKDFEKIITIEPHPLNVEILKMNLEINHVENVEIIEKALWSSEEKMKLHQNAENDLVGGVTLLDLPEVCESITVDAITLDSLNIRPDVIKIDIEGGELEALRGMEHTLKRYHPFVYIEAHPLQNWSNIDQTHIDAYPFQKDLITVKYIIRRYMLDMGYTELNDISTTEMVFSVNRWDK